ncbi:MAG: transketolase [Gammaproteobacteria bacterium]|nr:transketolase [Gammaproteobacteria bacterium]
MTTLTANQSPRIAPPKPVAGNGAAGRDAPTAEQSRLLYQAMLTAREVDRIEEEITRRGAAFFHVSGGGHEASAALALHLHERDWLNCHYRDKALMIARGLTARAFFDALYCKNASHSRGRQMSAHMSDADLRIASLTGPVGNAALHAVGMAMTVKRQDENSIVLCSAGDGMTQEGEFLEACAEAARSELPVLFLVEDNGWAISTPTDGKTFYSLNGDQPEEFHCIPIHRIDGRDVLGAWRVLGAVVDRMRLRGLPEIVVLSVERLSNHTNADDQTTYRDEADIRRSAATGDPIRIFERQLLGAGWTESELAFVRQEVAAQVAEADEQAALGADPEPTFTAKAPLPDVCLKSTHDGVEAHDRTSDAFYDPPLTMKDAIRETLRERLAGDSRVTMWGEDIEDPKGDVFGVTKGLSTEFPGRIGNSPLTESTIVGAAIGRALAGERPIAFLQFADFLPLAYNQIISELGSMHWRTDGQWTAPVIIMVPCGGYRPGLGPFHASSFESVMAHTPGIDVFMPSTASDAAGLLNAAFASERPTVFFYPKSCLNDPLHTTSINVADQVVAIGSARKVTSGRDITLVTWGNPVRLCERAAEALEAANIEAEVIDLRSLSPWDEQAVLSSVERTGRVIVVHEDNHTCGLGAEILATIGEKSRQPVMMRRVTRPDTYVPCNFANQIDVLPSLRRVLTTASEMLGLDLAWEAKPQAERGVSFVEAIGSGPSDETVVIVDLNVEPGQSVGRGDVVASLETTKSVFELMSPVSGVIEQVLAATGETVDVGAPLLKVRTADASQRPKPLTQEQPGTPIFTRRRAANADSVTVARSADAAVVNRQLQVGLSTVSMIAGSRRVTNEQLQAEMGGAIVEDIVRLTGIESRRWAGEGEDAVSLAARACEAALEREQLIASDLDLMICATTTPVAVTPSMAFRILSQVEGGRNAMLPAYDINAACSGYLYALRAGYDFLQDQPNGCVLVVTTEVLSPVLDPQDPDTRVIFGDAASATVLYGELQIDRAAARLYRPELSGKVDADHALTVPCVSNGYLQMDGRRVFREAVRAMMVSLSRACDALGLDVAELDLLVPHQANQRIIDAIQNRTTVPVYSNIKHYGNTSSSSIPLCLDELLSTLRTGQRLGLCAFGGGYTFGAGVIEARANVFPYRRHPAADTKAALIV